MTFKPDTYRAKCIGRIFQDPMKGSAPSLSIEQNLAIPYSSTKKGIFHRAISKKDREYFREVLSKLDMGLEDRMNNFPSQLSGGEQQRVSIARALAKNPKLLLCDEPTGALDYNTGKNILRLLQDTCRNDGVTVIVITHNSAIAPMADRVITVKNSKVDKVEINKDPVDVSTIEW